MLYFRYFGDGTCRFGERCSQAHSDDELKEWKDRFEQRRQEHAKNMTECLYSEQLMERLANAENPESIVRNPIKKYFYNF